MSPGDTMELNHPSLYKEPEAFIAQRIDFIPFTSIAENMVVFPTQLFEESTSFRLVFYYP
jgi:hypothetical protein